MKTLNGTPCFKCGWSVATIDTCHRGHSYCDSCWHEYERLFGWYEAPEWSAEVPCPECVREDFGGGEVLRLTNPQEDLFMDNRCFASDADINRLTESIDRMSDLMGLPLGSKPWHEDAKICDQLPLGSKPWHEDAKICDQLGIALRKRPSKS